MLLRPVLASACILLAQSVVASANESTDFNLPEGFKATLFADNLGLARHIAVAPNGHVYVALRSADKGDGIVALVDTDGDGRSDRSERFGGVVGTGIALNGGYLYFGTDTEIVRFRFNGDELVPSGKRESVISGFPVQGSHSAKPFTFDDKGHIYVNVGAPSNACQEKDREKGSPGMQACPQLELQAGIWRFDADKTGQVHGKDGLRYATGIRNAMALDWNFASDTLYFATHGRDQLGQLHGFSDTENAEIPAEEFHAASEGSNHGWPYTYWDPIKNARMLAPEYGGDGKQLAANADYRAPLLAFPGHWAPNDLLFYTGSAFAESYRGGAFLAFHGSWNRAPLPQAGYRVVFIPFRDGKPTGEWQNFAEGFAGKTPPATPGEARYRPVGMAVGPDGALYVSDSMKGRVWKISYRAL